MIPPTSAKIAKRAAGAVLLVCALGSGCLALSFRGSERNGASWKGYRVLLVDRSIPEAEILASLGAKGFEKVISESTEPVLVSDWTGLQSMSLSEARRLIAPGDLRIDAYLNRLGLWFDARAGGIAYRAYYVEARALSGSLGQALQSYKGRYLLPDELGQPRSREGSEPSFILALVLMFAAAAVAPRKGRSSFSLRALATRISGPMGLDRFAFRLSLILPWAILAKGGPASAFLASLWALAFTELADSLDLPLDEIRGAGGRAALRSLRLQGLPPSALALTAILALAIEPGFAGTAALSCAGSLLAAAGYASITAATASRKRFIPIPIGRKGERRRVSSAGKARVLLASASILAWCLGALLSPSEPIRLPGGIEYPIPLALRGDSKPSIAAARDRSGAESGNILPGLASLLAHRAYQESLPYVPIGELRPDPFAPVRLPLPGGEARLISFDDAWARGVYASLPSLSVEGMLLSQGGAIVGQVVGSTTSASARDAMSGNGGPLAPFGWLLYISLLVPLLARLLRNAAFPKGGLSGELRQEA